MLNQTSLKEKFKEIFGQGLIVALITALQSAINFIILPFITNYITPDEFGRYSLILLLTAFSSAIFYLGGSSALGRYYYEENSLEYKKQIVSASIIVSLIGAFLLICLGYISKSYISFYLFDNTKYELHIILALIGTSMAFINTTFTLILRYEKKFILFGVSTIISVLLNFAITYFLLTKQNLGILAPIYGTLISNSLLCIIFILFLWKNLNTAINTKIFRKLLLFGLPVALSSFLIYFLDWIDRFLIKELLTMKDVGVYSLGYRLGSIVNMLIILPFSLVWAPMRMRYSKEKDNLEFMTKIVSYLFVSGVTLIFFSIIYGDIFIKIFFPKASYADALFIYPIIMLGILIGGLINILDYGIYIHKKLHIYSVVAIICIVFNVISNYIFLPLYGKMAAAYITLLSFIIQTSLIYFFSNKYILFKLEFGRILVPIIFIILTYIITFHTNLFNDFIIVKKITLSTIYFVCLFQFWLDSKEKSVIRKTIKSFKPFV